MKVTKESLIADVMEAYPESVEVFLEYGLGCVSCGAASFESIEEGASAHFLSEEEIENLVKDLSEIDEFS